MSQGIDELLNMTESLLGLSFETDEESSGGTIESPEDGILAYFAPLRVATPVSSCELSAARVEDLWKRHDFTVTRTTEAFSGSLLIDGYGPNGEFLTCQFSPSCTLVTGEYCPSEPREPR